MASQKISPTKAKKLSEEKQALGLRKSGATYAEISDQLKISEATAWRRVQSALKAITKLSAKEAEDVKVLELARYDFYLRSLDPKIRLGDPRAINTALTVSERRARLLGLDAPEKHTLTLDTIDALRIKALAGDKDAAAELRRMKKELGG